MKPSHNFFLNVGVILSWLLTILALLGAFRKWGLTTSNVGTMTMMVVVVLRRRRRGGGGGPTT
jgi:hypothetical protein